METTKDFILTKCRWTEVHDHQFYFVPGRRSNLHAQGKMERYCEAKSRWRRFLRPKKTQAPRFRSIGSVAVSAVSKKQKMNLIRNSASAARGLLFRKTGRLQFTIPVQGMNMFSVKMFINVRGRLILTIGFSLA